MRKSRMGRPIEGDEPRNKQITFRVTETFLKKLAKCSEITGCTRTSLFESAICELYDKLVEDEE